MKLFTPLLALCLFSLVLPGALWSQEAGSDLPSTQEVEQRASDLVTDAQRRAEEIAGRVDQSQQAHEVSAGVLQPIYTLAESMAFPAFHWVAFTLMVAGVVSFGLQLVLGKLVLLSKMSFNIKEILADAVGLFISLIGLVLTTQAAAENSTFTTSPAAVLSATAVGAIFGLMLYVWGQRQEVEAARARRTGRQGREVDAMRDDSTEIVTERLRLRRWLPEDRGPFATMNADPRVHEFLPGPLTREQSDVIVDRIESHFEQRGFGLWAVEVPDVTRFAGFVGLAVPRFEASFMPCVEIGWRLAFEQWGHGYATEGARAALAFGFDQLQLDEIVSFTVPANLRSRRVMERIGMSHDPNGDFDHPLLPEGDHLRRHVLYRLSRKQWLMVNG